LLGLGPAACGQATSTAPAAPAALPAKALTALAALQPPVRRPATAPGDVPTAPAAREALRAGEKLLAQRRPEQAVAELEKALTADPNAAAVHRLLAFSYVAIRQPAKARPHLEKLARVAGDDVRVQMLLGRLAEVAGRPGEALRRYRTGLACTDATDAAVPTNEVLFLLGETLRRAGYLSAALECYQRLAANIDRHGAAMRVSASLRPLMGEPERLLLLQGRMLLALRRYAEATEALDAAYRQNKRLAPAGSLLIEALVAHKAYDRAEAVLLERLQGSAGAGGDETVKAIERLYRATGDPAGPARLLAAYKVDRPNPPASVLIALARACANLGGTDRAAAMLQAHRPLLRGQPEVLITLASWMLTEGKPDESLEVLADVLADDAASAEAARRQIDAAPAKTFTKAKARRYAASARADESKRKCALHYLAGLVARRVKLKHLAEQQWDLAIEADGKFSPAYEALARGYIDRAQYERVGGLADRARARGADPHLGHYLLGWAHMESGQSDKAIASLTQAVEAKGDHGPSRLLLARALLREGRLDEAARQLQAAAKVPGNERAQELLVSLYLRRYLERRRMGDTRAAAEQLARARDTVGGMLRADPSNRLGLRLLVQVQSGSGQYLLARQTLGRLLAVAPDDAAARLLKVQVEGRTGLVLERLGRRRAERAVADLNRVLKADPGNANALSLLAEVYVSRMRYDDAIGVLATACKRDADNAELAMQYALVLRRAGRPAAAAKVLGERLAKARQPEVFDRILYAAVLCEAAQGARAVKTLAKWIADETDDGDRLTYRVAQAHAHARAGAADAAEALVAKLLGENPGRGPRDLLESSRLAILAETRQFDRLAKQAVKWLDSTPVDEWRLRAERHLDLPRFIEMIFAHAGGVESRRRNPALIRAVTPIELALGWLCAAKAFEKAEALATEQVRRLSAKGGSSAKLASTIRSDIVRLLVLSRQRDRARKLFDTFVIDDPSNAGMLTFAYALYRDDDPANWAKCDRLLERAAAAKPFDVQAANNLGYVWADRGVKLNRAESLIRAALAREAMPHIQDSMGWVLYKKGSFRTALSFLLLALNAPEGDNAVVYDHIGDTYWRLGKADEAVRMWIEAADLAEVDLQREGDGVESDVRRVARRAVAKIHAVRAGRTPPVAPLGARPTTRPATRAATRPAGETTGN